MRAGLGVGAFLVLASGAARADLSDSYALQVDGDQARFTIDVNGLPEGVPGGRKLAGAAFFLDSLLRPGGNEVTVRVVLDKPYGTEQLTLTAPDVDGQEPGRRLAHVQCGFALPDGTTPACKMSDVFRIRFDAPGGPDFQLWHAGAAPVSVVAITAVLARAQKALVQDAKRQDWAGLYLGGGVRRADLLQAGRGVALQAAEMAKDMQAAAKKGGDALQAGAPPDASDLIFTALPDHLVAVTRKDGAPVLRVQVGAGGGHDPEDFGDYGDRFLGGIYQEMWVIVGYYGSGWVRVR